MRKPYRKGSVHPTPPLISGHLSFLPATILTLTVALSPEDKEVLAYLISCSTTNFSGDHKATSTKKGADHPTSFSCYCFRCYMSYWMRWDSSPNRQQIHDIIDAFEEGLLNQSRKEKNRKEKRKINNNKGANGSGENKRAEQNMSEEERSSEQNMIEDGSNCSGGAAGTEDCCGGDEEDFEKGSVRKFLNFLGEKIWNVLA